MDTLTLARTAQALRAWDEAQDAYDRDTTAYVNAWFLSLPRDRQDEIISAINAGWLKPGAEPVTFANISADPSILPVAWITFEEPMLSQRVGDAFALDTADRNHPDVARCVGPGQWLREQVSKYGGYTKGSA